MGGSSSKDAAAAAQQLAIEERIDFGTVLPNGIYPSTQQDFDLRVARRFICERKLAPFYKGLADALERTTSSMPATAAPPPMSPPPLPSPPPPQPPAKKKKKKKKQPTAVAAAAAAAAITTAPLPPSITHLGKNRSRSGTAAPSVKQQQPTYDEETVKPFLYHNAIECPICFLYYPANINHARCCDQPVCTECFLQIKRNEDKPSDPATCPFCLENNFGVVYTPPAWSEARTTATTSRTRVSPTMETRHTTAETADVSQPRRKSIKHNNAEVVLVDHVRPDWGKPRQPQPRASLASRRNSDTRGGLFRTRRPTRPNRSASAAVPPQPGTVNQHDMDFDVEEYMIMEAIRLSLQDQEAFRRRSNDNSHHDANAEPAGATSHPNEDRDAPVLSDQQPSSASTLQSTIRPPSS